MKTIKFAGKTFEFHNPNGFGWTLLWSDGWEIVDEAAKALGWKRIHHGRNAYGHVSYHI